MMSSISQTIVLAKCTKWKKLLPPVMHLAATPTTQLPALPTTYDILHKLLLGRRIYLPRRSVSKRQVAIMGVIDLKHREPL
jgi:hypothetical protein